MQFLEWKAIFQKKSKTSMKNRKFSEIFLQKFGDELKISEEIAGNNKNFSKKSIWRAAIKKTETKTKVLFRKIKFF